MRSCSAAVCGISARTGIVEVVVFGNYLYSYCSTHSCLNIEVKHINSTIF